MAKLSVVILNWNQPQLTVQCIQAISTWKNLCPTLWVVDNASQDESQTKIAQICPGIHYICSEINRGFAGGNNLAIQEILKFDDYATLLLNNDATISEDSVIKLIESMSANKQLGIIGPLLYSPQENPGLVSLGGRDIACHVETRLWVKKKLLAKLPLQNDLFFVDYVPGSVALIKTQLFRDVGLLDKEYFFSGEMADFCERARQKGFLCAVNVEVSATHQIDSTSPMRQTLYLYYNLRNRFLFIRKFRSSKRIYLLSFWTLYGVLLFFRALVRAQKKRAKAIALALIDGLRGRFGIQNDRILS